MQFPYPLLVADIGGTNVRMALADAPDAPLADLPVREIVATSHLLADLTLAPVEPVFSYLEATR